MTQLFKDTFIFNDFSAWTGVFGWPSVVSTPGNFEPCPASAQIPATNYVYATIGANATSYFRAYVYLDALPPDNSADQELLSVWSEGSNWRTGVLSVRSTGKFYISWHSNGYWYNSSDSVSVLSAGQWYCLELYTVIGASGETKVYLNGVEETACSQSGIDNSDRWVGTLGIDIGGMGTLTGSVATTYYTDVIVADQYVGPDNLAVNNLTVYENATIGGLLSASTLNVTSDLIVTGIDNNVIGNIHLVQDNGINYIESFLGSSTSAPLKLTGYEGTQTAIQTYYNTLDDGSGNMTLGVRGSNIHLFTPSGYNVYITTYDGMGPYPGVLWVKYGLRADDIQANGFLSTTSVNIGGTGGGALFMGHGYAVSNDMPVIELQDQNYNTLWLKAGNGSPQSLPWANLALGSLIFNQYSNAQVTLNTGYTTESGYNIAYILPSIAPVLSGGNWLGGVGLGTTSYFWNYVDSAYYFAKYTSIIQFDILDDLALVKNSKGKHVGDKQVIDLDSLPHLRPDSTEKTDEIDLGKAIGFSIGCHKASALKHDEHDAAIANLLMRTEKLEEGLKSYTRSKLIK